MYNNRIFAIILLVLPILAGCSRGPVRGSVQGEVKLNGQPLDGGRIFFIPQGSNSVAAEASVRAGQFELSIARGPSVGKCRIEVRLSRKTGRKIEVPPNSIVEETVEVIPASYNKESTLELDVKPGLNRFDVDIRL